MRSEQNRVFSLSSPHGPTILNIDDDPAKRYAISRHLRRAGYNVIEAETGAEGLERLAQHQPDVAIVDVKLPDIDGFELCRKIKEDPANSAMAVLHLSAAFVNSEDRARGLDSGADAYLAYPVEPFELTATVNSLLRVRAAEADARRLAAQWQTTFDAIADGISFINADGTVTRANRALSKLFDLPDQDVIGFNIEDLIGRQLIDTSDREPGWLVGAEQRSLFEVSSDERSFRITIDPVSGADGGAVCTIIDFSDRKRIEEQLAYAYDREHRIAETLQRSLLLTTPAESFANVDIRTFYEPASDEASVGGDFFDTFLLPDGRVALVVSDAAGKGLAAAARTAEVKFALRAYLKEHLDTAGTLTLLNQFLQEGARFDSLMVAVSLAVIDGRTGRIAFSCAGAEPPLIVRADGDTINVSQSALPLGAFDVAEYSTLEFELEGDDFVLLATDGITEARHGSEFLGHEGMTLLAQRYRHKNSLEEIGKAILNEARAFAGGKFQDDVCLLIARTRREA